MSAAAPHVHGAGDDDVVLRVTDLEQAYRVGRGRGARVVHAVDGVSFTVRRGAIVGLVGESGCGKTTTARCVTALVRPTAGRIELYGTGADGRGSIDIAQADAAGLRRVHRDVKMVFQDPFSSLNPRMTVGQIVGEGLELYSPELDRSQRRDAVAALLAQVGLDPTAAGDHPRRFSGGQRQRIGIARALSAHPRLLVCDEAVSALDVSIQAQICNLLLDTREALGLSILFISHDLAVVRQLCDEVVVMRAGRVVEAGPVDDVFGSPREDYTRELLAATPVPVVAGAGGPSERSAAPAGTTEAERGSL